MSEADSQNTRQNSYESNSINIQESRMRRHEVAIGLRKSKGQTIKRRHTVEFCGQTPVELSVDEIVAAMNSEDQEHQFKGVQLARKMLSRDINPPIDQMIGHGIVPICVRFLQNATNTMLQFEAAWALTNIAFGTSDQTRCVIDHNAVPHFVALLQSQDIQLADQAVWALGNIAGEGPAARDIVIHHNVIDGILPLINNETPLLFLRNIVWLMSNLCRGKNGSPPFEQVKRLLPVLSQLLQSQDIEVLAHACWALSYVADDEDCSKIQAVVDSDAVPRLVKLLQTVEPTIILPALCCVGNIVTGTDEQTDVVIASGGLPRLGFLLQHSNSKIVKDAAWTVSNIVAGSQQQIQAVIQAGIFQQLRNVLENGDYKAQREAAWAVTNTLALGTPEQVVDLIENYRILQPFINLLESEDPETVKVVQDGIWSLLAVAEKLPGTQNLA